jgi:hypothetical protein
MNRYAIVAATAVLAVSTAIPAVAAAPARTAEEWHSVTESWQPYPESELVLPADRYCGDFAVRSTPVFADVSSRVLSRWESGGARETIYSGPLQVEATNTTSDGSVQLDLSGFARTKQRPDGSLARYEALGPVGFGWPTGSVGLPQGYYVFDGRHVVRFPKDGPRRLVVDQGTETDVCALLD